MTLTGVGPVEGMIDITTRKVRTNMHILIMIILTIFAVFMLVPLLIELLKLVVMVLVPAIMIMVAYILWKKAWES